MIKILNRPPSSYKSPSTCPSCHGTGNIEIWRNAKGEDDHINGSPTGEVYQCDNCQGWGMIDA